MTWKQLVEAAVAAGVSDDTPIWFVDFHGDDTPLRVLAHDRHGVALLNSALAVPDEPISTPDSGEVVEEVPEVSTEDTVTEEAEQQRSTRRSRGSI